MTIAKGPRHTAAIFLDVEKASTVFTMRLLQKNYMTRHSQDNRLPKRKKNARSKLANANKMPSTPEQEYPKEA